MIWFWFWGLPRSKTPLVSLPLKRHYKRVLIFRINYTFREGHLRRWEGGGVKFCRSLQTIMLILVADRETYAQSPFLMFLLFMLTISFWNNLSSYRLLSFCLNVKLPYDPVCPSDGRLVGNFFGARISFYLTSRFHITRQTTHTREIEYCKIYVRKFKQKLESG